MQSIILPLSTESALKNIEDCGFALVTAVPLTGKTVIIRQWLLHKNRGTLWFDFFQKMPTDEQKQAFENLLDKLLSDPGKFSKEYDFTENPEGRENTKQTGIEFDCFNINKQKEKRFVVVIDHLPPHDDEAISADGWLSSVIERYETKILFFVLSNNKPSGQMLRLAFEHHGLLLDQSGLQLGIEDLAKAQSENKWLIHAGTLAHVCEKSQKNNLVLLYALNEYLPKGQKFYLPSPAEWIEKSFRGLDTAEIACVKLLSQLDWTLPGILSLIMPKKNSRDFGEILGKRLWIDEYTFSGHRLLRLKPQIKVALKTFTTQLPGIVFKPAHYWMINTLYKNYVPASDTLKTWIGLNQLGYLEQMLSDLAANSKLKQFAESTDLMYLNQIPEDLFDKFSLLQALVYSRAVNSLCKPSIEQHHKLWEKHITGSGSDNALNRMKQSISPDYIILSAADKSLFSKNNYQSINPVSPLSQIPHWLEISSRLLLVHTIVSLSNQPPKQQTFAQLEKIALRAAAEQDVNTALDALRVLALFNLRYGFYEYYLKVSRYLSDWAKHFDSHQQSHNEILNTIKLPISLLYNPAPSLKFTHDYTDMHIVGDPANAFLLYFGFGFHFAWQNQWQLCADFLEAANEHYQLIAEPIKKYTVNPKLLSQLIRLSLDEPIDPINECDPSDSNYALWLLAEGLQSSKNESFVSAEKCFKDALEGIEKTGHKTELSWLHAVVCLYHMTRNNKKTALESLLALLQMKEQSDILLPIGLLGKYLKPLLEYGNQQRVVQTDQIKLCTQALPYLFEESDATPTISSLLSKREYEILHYMSEGRSNDQISKLLHRSVGTIKLHAHNIYKKLGVKNRVEAINLYKQAGLLEGSPTPEENQ